MGGGRRFGHPGKSGEWETGGLGGGGAGLGGSGGFVGGGGAGLGGFGYGLLGQPGNGVPGPFGPPGILGQMGTGIIILIIKTSCPIL